MHAYSHFIQRTLT